MSNIQGRVKFTTLDTLFQAGYLPSPQDVEAVLTEIVDILHERKWKESEFNKHSTYDKLPTLVKLFKSETTPSPYKHWKINNSLIDMLYKKDYEHLRNYYFQAQDIRKVLEVLSVSKMSQGSFVMADKFTLCALERVANDTNYYEDLLNLVHEELDRLDK